MELEDNAKIDAQRMVEERKELRGLAPKVLRCKVDEMATKGWSVGQGWLEFVNTTDDLGRVYEMLLSGILAELEKLDETALTQSHRNPDDRWSTLDDFISSHLNANKLSSETNSQLAHCRENLQLLKVRWYQLHTKIAFRSRGDRMWGELLSHQSAPTDQHDACPDQRTFSEKRYLRLFLISKEGHGMDEEQAKAFLVGCGYQEFSPRRSRKRKVHNAEDVSDEGRGRWSKA
ncbi:MAG: hypothetical protein M1816_001460 [Peltula sp. TS41687]|nr:MAG: hypothetical protein M1816_001460 [Peltula sp. TS41687]